MQTKGPERKISIGIGLFGLFVLFLILGIPFVKTWFYCLAWWPLILFLDGLNARLFKSSPMSAGGKRFLLIAFLSVTVWLIFEAANFRLQNWSYHSLPACTWQRWIGYAAAFATVIPALEELAFLFGGFLRKKDIRFFSLKPNVLILASSMALGTVMLGLSLGRPDLFFPLIWVGLILVIDPLSDQIGGASLFRDWAKNQWTRTAAWLLAGLSAGILWEGLNFWAGSHWEYHLPYLDFGRIFQMPVFGFLGFPPFALEIFVLLQLILSIRDRLKGKPVLQGFIVLALLIFDLAVFYGMDLYTVIP